MATTDVNIKSSSKNFIKSISEFETELKNKLKWNRSKWVQMGENSTRIHKLCNSLQYWKQKLKPAVEKTSIVLTIFNYEKDVRTELFQIITAIESSCSGVEVQGFSDFRNPRYLCVYFKNEEDKKKVLDNFRMLNESYVVFLSWALEEGPTTTALKVHWLPMTLDLEIIKKELERYVFFIEEKRIFRTSMGGRDLLSGKVAFEVKLNDGVKKEDIPHLVEIANMEALITVEGRLPLCLNCDRIGHISKECKVRYCERCNSLKPKDHVCSQNLKGRSYAAVVKDDKDSIDPDDWGAAIVVDKTAPVSTKKTELATRISGLEVQIQHLKSQEYEIKKIRLNKKRKVSATIANNVEEKGPGVDLKNEDRDVQVDWSSQSQGDESESEEDLSMNFESLETIDMQSGKIVISDNKLLENAETNQFSNQLEHKSVENQSQYSMRSYGKPIYNNSRRIKEERKFDKIVDKRDFVFDD